MTTLSVAIAAATPRETAGARTAARYSFQAHVSLAHILDLHQAGSDYRAVFDYLDDLAILNATADPTAIRFYQIKGKERGGWSAASLCSVSGATPRTTIGKMYHHTGAFGNAVEAAVFLTNAPFSFTLSDGTATTADHTSIAYADLAVVDQKRFAAALEIDFPSPRSPNEAVFVRFERTQVPITGFAQFVKGRLVELVEEGEGIAISALYRTLIEDVSTKIINTQACQSVDDVFNWKSLSKTDFDAVLSSAASRRSILDHWVVVDDELKEAGRSPTDRIRIKTATVEYLQTKSKRARDTVELSQVVRTAISAVSPIDSAQGLVAAANHIASAIPDLVSDPLDSVRLQASLLVEAFEVLHG